MSKPTETHERTPRRAAIAAWIGSALEYYDFSVYGTAAVLVLNTLFFPPSLPAGIRLLLSMATLAVGYVVRPLGALIMGPLADRFGRRFVMMLTLFGIGACTFLVGCLPTYADAGVIAPILLVTLRIIQGLSVSGEQSSAITMSLEHADEGKRGLTASWTLNGTQAGGLLATGIFIPVTAYFSQAQLQGWAWRIPFWLSAVVVVAAYIIRRRLEEPPAFLETQAIKVHITPLKQTLRFHWAAIVRVAACALLASVNYVFASFSVGFATNGYQLDKPTMLWVPVVVNLVALGAIPLAGILGDKIGRKPLFLVGVIGSGILTAPYLWSITTGNWALIFVLGVLANGLLYSAANGIWPSFYAEMFPNRVRVSGLALGTQIGFAVAGGVAPVLSTALAGPQLHDWVGPSILTVVLCAISAIAAATAKETGKLTLDQIDELQQTDHEVEVVTGAIRIPVTARAAAA
jgi:MFS family permease